MARPIEATPVLTGKDADTFIKSMNAAVMTNERREWLRAIANESAKAEKSNK